MIPVRFCTGIFHQMLTFPAFFGIINPWAKPEKERKRCMFKRVGKEIKTWAKVLVILEMIPIVIAGVAVAMLAFAYDEELIIPGILCGILIVVLGYFIARLSSIMLYAKGELVDRVMRIDEKLERMEKMQHPAAPAPSPYAPPSYGYVPPAPAPVNVPVQAAPAAKAPVPSAPVVTAPVQTAPVVSVPVHEDPVEEDYTVAAVSRPAPKPVYTAPVQNAPAEWICPNCGQRNNADGNWCRNCGTKKSV